MESCYKLLQFISCNLAKIFVAYSMVKGKIIIKVVEVMKTLDLKPQHIITLTNFTKKILVTLI